MKKDNIFNTDNVGEDFTFNENVAEVFDDMLNRSIPFYGSVINGIAELIKQLAPPGVKVYDLGCSTGTTLLELARHLPEMNLSYIGIDNSPAMIAKAKRKTDMYSAGSSIRFVEDDITEADLPEAGILICNYTLQFLRPMLRLQFIRHMHDSLPEGGLLFLSEKVINHDKKLNRTFIEMYHSFKRRQGYSELEIAAKRESLENVLVPFSMEENMDIVRQAGFRSIEPFFQWFNFVSFIAIK